jgi:hypothetical protein
MSREISEGRQAGFYAGTALMVIGGLLFCSFFLIFFSGNGGSAEERSISKVVGHPVRQIGPHEYLTTDSGAGRNNMGGAIVRGVLGFGLMVLGRVVRSVSAKGLAGSGIILDTEQAREDLEPYSRMTGGMVKDALEEMGGNPLAPPVEKVVLLKCQACGFLNREDAKFCQECGGKI